MDFFRQTECKLQDIFHFKFLPNILPFGTLNLPPIKMTILGHHFENMIGPISIIGSPEGIDYMIPPPPHPPPPDIIKFPRSLEKHRKYRKTVGINKCSSTTCSNSGVLKIKCSNFALIFSQIFKFTHFPFRECISPRFSLIFPWSGNPVLCDNIYWQSRLPEVLPG